MASDEVPWHITIAARLAAADTVTRAELRALMPDMGNLNASRTVDRRARHLTGSQRDALHYAYNPRIGSGSGGARSSKLLSKLLIRYETYGWIQRDGDQIRVLDRQALQRRATRE